MANSNGVITAPIGLVDVQQVLGESSTDLATLCKSSKINKWSAKKPIYYPTQTNPKVQQLTDAEFKNQNYGLVIDNGMAHYAAEIVRLSAAQTDFRYVAVNAPYRLSDFNGYNHNLDSWFTLDIDHHTTIAKGSVIPCSFRHEDMGLNLDFFSRMAYYGGGNQHDWCVGFIMNPTSSWTTSTRTCWVCICGRIDEVLADDKFRIYTSTAMSAGSYYVIPVIFSASSVDSSRLDVGGDRIFQSSMNDIISGEWRYMPTKALGQSYPPILILTDNPSPHPSINVLMEVGVVEYYYLQDAIKIISLPVTIDVENYQGTIDVTFTFNNSVQISRTNVSAGDTIDIASTPIVINTYPLLPENVNVNMVAEVVTSGGARGTANERIIEA